MLFVVAQIKCGEIVVDCKDILRVLGSVEVLTIGLFDLDVSVFRSVCNVQTNTLSIWVLLLFQVFV